MLEQIMPKSRTRTKQGPQKGTKKKKKGYNYVPENWCEILTIGPEGRRVGPEGRRVGRAPL